jgi:hypothetical protein
LEAQYIINRDKLNCGELLTFPGSLMHGFRGVEWQMPPLLLRSLAYRLEVIVDIPSGFLVKSSLCDVTQYVRPLALVRRDGCTPLPRVGRVSGGMGGL